MTLLEFWNEWQSVISTVITMIALGVGIRRLEVMMRHKKSEDRRNMYNKLGALELAMSDHRSEMKAIRISYEELREGCQVIESKADESMVASAKAEQNGDTILALIGKRKG